MDKQFEEFTAKAPEHFRESMVKFWMEDENITRAEAFGYYGGQIFDAFCDRIAGQAVEFIPDLGYIDKSKDGTLCFEKIDNNFVIPVSILEAL